MYNLKLYNLDNNKSINFSPLHNWAVSNTEGLTSVNVEMSTSQGINQIGTTIQGKSVQDKLITIEGSIIGPSRLYRKQLIDTITPQANMRLVFDNKLFIDGSPEVTPDISRHAHNANFQFQLRCPYPYWRSLDRTATPLSGLVGKFRFPINYSTPHMFGQRILLSYQNVLNSGNVPVPFIVKFHAATRLLNPKILNIRTLEFIRVEKEMASGETITVDMTGRTFRVTSGVTGTEENIFNYFDIVSNLFKLDVGDNLIRADADENSNGLNCTIYHYLTTSGAYGDDKTYV